MNMDNLTFSNSSASTTAASDISEEVSSMEWELIKLGEDEEDLINKMYRLVGNRWDLIAGRIPGRKAEEIERFWIITHTESFAHKNEAKDSPK